jgi:hypothetical protein
MGTQLEVYMVVGSSLCEGGEEPVVQSTCTDQAGATPLYGCSNKD